MIKKNARDKKKKEKSLGAKLRLKTKKGGGDKKWMNVTWPSTKSEVDLFFTIYFLSKSVKNATSEDSELNILPRYLYVRYRLGNYIRISPKNSINFAVVDHPDIYNSQILHFIIIFLDFLIIWCHIIFASWFE